MLSLFIGTSASRLRNGRAVSIRRHEANRNQLWPSHIPSFRNVGIPNPMPVSVEDG
jgi:hypothetical protein